MLKLVSVHWSVVSCKAVSRTREPQCYRWLREPEQATVCQLNVAPCRLHCKKSYWSAHACLSECAALVQVLESDLATSQQQSTCIHNDLKSEAAHVGAQLEAERMAMRQQLERVEEAERMLAQQQQTRIQVKAPTFTQPRHLPLPPNLLSTTPALFQRGISSCELP